MLSARLRSLRATANLTQKALAERAQLSRAYLAALERGLHSGTQAPPRPSRAVLSRLAIALGVPPAELLQGPLPFAAEAMVSLPCWGEAPGPNMPEVDVPWRWPEAEAVVHVTAGVAPGLGLEAGDSVLVRTCLPGSAPQGLCLFASRGTWQWGRVGYIQDRPYLEAADGSYRPLSIGCEVLARAIAVVRPLPKSP